MTTSARPLAVLLLVALAACGDSTAPASHRPPIPAADSLLVASLAGSFAYADSIDITWREADQPGRTLEVRSGSLTTSVVSVIGLELAQVGVRSRWIGAQPSYSTRDSVRAFVLFQRDSLQDVTTLGIPTPIPRAAVSDSGLHWSVANSRGAPCEVAVDFFVPGDATDVACRVAVHWRRP